jgi:tetratricopeptide (TPR) repeat protein
MTAGDDLVFSLAWDDIDLATLPDDSRQPGSDAFRRAVTLFLQGQYEPLGGKARIVFNDTERTLTVQWAKRAGYRSVEEKVQEALGRGDVSVAIPLLKALIAAGLDNPTPLYNLGMVYSDQGRLEEAKALLRQAAALDAENAQIMIAIGVAHARNGDLAAAIATLELATTIDPEDSFAHQNLGACLLKQDDAERAVDHFRKSLRRDPDNLRSRFGLAQSLETLDRLHDADEVYQEIIKAAGHTPVGEWAKEGRTRIAHALLRKGGDQRPDVLMYCLGALERFEGMPKQEIQAIGQEIAVLGMRGLDINDPSKKYTLRLLPGEFSGLHLVSMMYVAYQQFAPDLDVGINLAAEYAAAKELHDARRG